ncbi:hypothetical protein P152DRAFT_266876 [Eremomyces bilateralis CBS 781.70]|uniref:Uncharacterized protein n=1 Tax=Eremomyces bilateralis CBS 781.70 TaxID=1392243 RepID=A0A6G1G872_9PEZI|nr:uncharacterized protein P152DRAFT_266876 [Eremomyces bilateralis CBS 781.70]KAF1814305.1 hypothetical protein P152DRAFT_266876 [Eremomyces bilateralis CBS 781.70]
MPFPLLFFFIGKFGNNAFVYERSRCVQLGVCPTWHAIHRIGSVRQSAVLFMRRCPYCWSLSFSTSLSSSFMFFWTLVALERCRR